MIDWFHTFVCIVNLGIKNYCLVPGIWDSPPTSHSWNLWCNVQPGRNWVSHWCLCLSADVWLVYASFVVLAVDTGLLMVLIASFLIRASLKCDPSKWMNKSAWAWSVESSGDWKLNQPHASTQTLSVSCSTTPRASILVAGVLACNQPSANLRTIFPWETLKQENILTKRGAFGRLQWETPTNLRWGITLMPDATVRVLTSHLIGCKDDFTL